MNGKMLHRLLVLLCVGLLFTACDMVLAQQGPKPGDSGVVPADQEQASRIVNQLFPD